MRIAQLRFEVEVGKPFPAAALGFQAMLSFGFFLVGIVPYVGLIPVKTVVFIEFFCYIRKLDGIGAFLLFISSKRVQKIFFWLEFVIVQGDLYDG